MPSFQRTAPAGGSKNADGGNAGLGQQVEVGEGAGYENAVVNIDESVPAYCESMARSRYGNHEIFVVLGQSASM